MTVDSALVAGRSGPSTTSSGCGPAPPVIRGCSLGRTHGSSLVAGLALGACLATLWAPSIASRMKSVSSRLGYWLGTLEKCEQCQKDVRRPFV